MTDLRTRCVNPKHLFLGTKADNNADRAAKGRNGDQRGQKNPLTKLTDKTVLAVRAARKRGATYKEIAAEFGILRTTIVNICLHTWQHIGETQ